MGKVLNGLRLNLILCMFVLCSAMACATTLYGTIYDLDLEPVENALVEINTEPAQRYLAKTGEYSFEVPKGKFWITVTYDIEGLNYTYKESVVVVQEGSYVFDIFLFPETEEEEELVEDAGMEIDVAEEEISNHKLLIAGIIVLSLLIILFLFRQVSRYAERTEETDIRADIQSDYEKMILEQMQKNDGRMTQKELRREIPLSEAKISLLITELEHKGIVEKIKKGRSNVVILKKKK